MTLRTCQRFVGKKEATWMTLGTTHFLGKVVSMDDLGDMPEFCKKKEVTWRTLGTSHFLRK